MGRRSKAKGSSFERLICRELSLMVTRGKRTDCFWRSAMSGGRATVHGGRVRQSGDIAAVAPEGNHFVSHYCVECKHYRDLQIARFVIERKGILAKFWTKLTGLAQRRNLMPVLIAKQNRLPIFVVCGTAQNPTVVSFKTWLRLNGGSAVRRSHV